MEISKRQRVVMFTDEECKALATVSQLFKTLYESISDDEEAFDGYMDSDLMSLANSLKEAAENRRAVLVSE